MPRSLHSARTAVLLSLPLVISGVGDAWADEPAPYAIEKKGAAVDVGAPGKASLAVLGKNGWHVNGEAPITVSLVAEPGVKLSKPKLTRADLAESSAEKARFDIAFTADAAGTKKITADTRFVMCQAQACKPAKEIVTLEVAVAEARATHPAGKPAKAARAAKPAAPAAAEPGW
jgi:hypothetical protein